MIESTENLPSSEENVSIDREGDSSLEQESALSEQLDDRSPSDGQSDPAAAYGDLSDEVTEGGGSRDSLSSSTREADSPESDLSGPESPGQDVSGVLTRVSLGGALLAVDALSDRLERLEEAEETRDQGPRTIDSVLVQEADWQERFGVAPRMAARHITLGVMIDTRSRARKGLKLLNNIGNATFGALEMALGPIAQSRLLRPLRRGFNSAVKRGELQVNHWTNMGRTEDIRSRALAETALTQAVDDSMDDVVENERVQDFVQEMLAAQSIGIVDEAIEEIRERAVSSDTFFEIAFRRFFRRAPRRSIPGPEFDRQLVRPPSKRNIQIDEGSLLGYYAGFTSRLLAFAVDAVIVMVFMALAGWLFQTIGSFLGESSSLNSLNLTDEVLNTASFVLGGLNAVTVIVAYAFVFWILTGQTPGMMLLGLRVVTRDGGHLTFWRAIGRLIGFIISTAFLFLGFAWILVDDRRQGWHDKIAGTYVVYSWDAHPDETFLRMRI
jgi:uncharacterized RDD family membrane protein YckC